VVGKQYAETHKTPFGFRIAEMVYPGHTPGITLGGGRVEVVGIFELIVTRPGTEVTPVKQALQSSLGSEVEVRVVGR
jgi:hypothetical protein